MARYPEVPGGGRARPGKVYLIAACLLLLAVVWLLGGGVSSPEPVRAAQGIEEPDLTITIDEIIVENVDCVAGTYDLSVRVTVRLSAASASGALRQSFHVEVTAGSQSSIQRVQGINVGRPLPLDFHFSGLIIPATPTPGEVVAVVDVHNQILETDETNNEDRESYTQPTCTDLSITLTASCAGDGSIQVEVLVENTTSNAAGQFFVNDGQTTQPIPGLAGNQTLPISYLVPHPTAGYTLTAEVDVNDNVPETNESNNTASIRIEPCPDLIISLFYDCDPSVGARVGAIVTNIGATATARTTTATINQRIEPVPTLAAKGTHVIPLQALSSAVNGVTAEVDPPAANPPRGVVPEADETNNVDTAGYIRCTDLSLRITHLAWNADCELEWALEVKNAGPHDAQGAVVEQLGVQPSPTPINPNLPLPVGGIWPHSGPLSLLAGNVSARVSYLLELDASDNSDTRTIPPRPASCDPKPHAEARINFDQGKNAATAATQAGTLSIVPLGTSTPLVTWNTPPGGGNTNCLSFPLPGPSNVAHVEVYFTPDSGGPPIRMNIVNHVPGMRHVGWVERGRCHALEVEYP